MSVDFSTQEGILREWDRWADYYKNGGGGSWPRDFFESLLDYYDEKIRRYRAALTSISCLVAEGPEFMTKLEICEAVSKEIRKYWED